MRYRRIDRRDGHMTRATIRRFAAASGLAIAFHAAP